MIAKEKIYNLIEPLLDEMGVFVVSLEVSPFNKITLLIDNMEGVKVNECIAFSRKIESNLNREEEDFELEVSSPGLTSPFRVAQQYKKNIGQEVEVVHKDGLKHKGILLNVSDETFTIEEQKRVKVEGKKKKQSVSENITYTFQEVSIVRVLIKF